MENQKVKKTKSVSGKLLAILLPMIALSIIVIMLIVATQARNVITGLAMDNLKKESERKT